MVWIKGRYPCPEVLRPAAADGYSPRGWKWAPVGRAAAWAVSCPGKAPSGSMGICAARTLPPQKLATSIKAPANPYLIQDFIVLLPSRWPLATLWQADPFISGQKIRGICEGKMRLCEAKVKSGGSQEKSAASHDKHGGWPYGKKKFSRLNPCHHRLDEGTISAASSSACRRAPSHGKTDRKLWIFVASRPHLVRNSPNKLRYSNLRTL